MCVYDHVFEDSVLGSKPWTLCLLAVCGTELVWGRGFYEGKTFSSVLLLEFQISNSHTDIFFCPRELNF